MTIEARHSTCVACKDGLVVVIAPSEVEDHVEEEVENDVTGGQEGVGAGQLQPLPQRHLFELQQPKQGFNFEQPKYYQFKHTITQCTSMSLT